MVNTSTRARVETNKRRYIQKGLVAPKGVVVKRNITTWWRGEKVGLVELRK